ncbi:PucR family transcriptional regulator [Nonomuraea sp. PA05]|uniref:PucR family transcriptional regulator n=1 Tax=Nonomuraea sp. PA05 TaxID=2604466 RepID=UPI0011D8B9F9|nr:PucR family transcriptional regulator [Nonomuraea sp. PA05]TYB47655.1 PucR family transcriptional regulator [Nonomuraea sp. PA05]
MITLDRLVNVLGGYGVRLCNRPQARTAWLRSVAVADAADRHVSGDLLLAVGASSLAEAMEWATAAKATAVLVKAPTTGPGDQGGADATGPGGGADADVEAAALSDRGGAGVERQAAALGDRHHLAVLLAEPAVSWSQLAGVVYGLVLESRETASGRGPTDLFALADSLADVIGGAVTIEDRHWRVLAYSRSQEAGDPARLETILARRVPDRLRELFQQQGVLTRLAADEPVFVPADPGNGLTGRMAVAVRAGRELLGSVWVTCERPLTGAHRHALADGARTVALHLLRSRASADLERQVESDLVIRLLDGSADAVTAISRLGLAARPWRVVAVRAHTGGERQAALLLAFEQATTGFGWSRPGRSALLGDTLYTILPAEQAESARRWITALRAELPGQVHVAAGIGAPAEVAELPASRQEADECLALHEDGPPGAVPPAYDESWGDILLRRLRAAARTGRVPARGPVSTLLRHDSRHGTHFAATLRAWLESQGDLASAAERLGVHPNTVRNRLRKMGELAPLDLDDARQRLAMTIMLAASSDEVEQL